MEDARQGAPASAKLGERETREAQAHGRHRQKVDRDDRGEQRGGRERDRRDSIYLVVPTF